MPLDIGGDLRADGDLFRDPTTGAVVLDFGAVRQGERKSRMVTISSYAAGDWVRATQPQAGFEVVPLIPPSEQERLPAVLTVSCVPGDLPPQKLDRTLTITGVLGTGGIRTVGRIAAVTEASCLTVTGIEQLETFSSPAACEALRDRRSVCIHNCSSDLDLRVRPSTVSASGAFAVEPTELTVEPGGTVCIDVTFAPMVEGAFPGELHLLETQGPSVDHVVPLQGTATATVPPALAVDRVEMVFAFRPRQRTPLLGSISVHNTSPCQVASNIWIRTSGNPFYVIDTSGGSANSVTQLALSSLPPTAVRRLDVTCVDTTTRETRGELVLSLGNPPFATGNPTLRVPLLAINPVAPPNDR